MPNGKMTLEKWNAQLAAEEALKNWNTLSEPALDKFIKDNFDKSWSKFDAFDRGQIDVIEAIPFIRDLM